MLKIRLQRTGRKNVPTFRIVLTDSKNSTKSGKFLEILGNHDTRNEAATEIKADRVKHWIAQGAQLSETLHNLFIDKKIIQGKKVNVLPKKKPIIDEAALAEAAKKAEAEKAAAEAAEAAKKAEQATTESAQQNPAQAHVETTAPQAPTSTESSTV